MSEWIVGCGCKYCRATGETKERQLEELGLSINQIEKVVKDEGGTNPQEVMKILRKLVGWGPMASHLERYNRSIDIFMWDLALYVLEESKGGGITNAICHEILWHHPLRLLRLEE
ncbi:MAG: hypothetical protein IPJ68_05350 [Candidatus Moraniibacteriota bacterium]|nr:MAG: hypothetical protein IPJ68_05350 [Candidatus Moranbacteria bacterium]